MESPRIVVEPKYRVWLVRMTGRRPRDWRELPERAVAMHPLEDDEQDAAAAAAFVEGFNQSVLDCGADWWAVAVPVAREFAGDLQGGLAVDISRLASWVLDAAATSWQVEHVARR